MIKKKMYGKPKIIIINNFNLAGLSRQLLDTGNIVTSPFGTVTHIAPEFILKGRCSFKSDVYSFAILWWELLE